MSSTWPLVPSALPSAVLGRTSTFLGKGLRSPLREDPATGGFQTVSAQANVSQCLKDGILTRFGERVMAEPCGTLARTLLFEESEVVADLLEPSIKDFVDRFEPRVALQSVTVEETSNTGDVVSFRCAIVYVVRATNTRHNLVFPFYLVSDAEGAQ